jgi:Na+-translocating ferredoxin:NAD+ oxidoreductase RnfA subunit
MSELAQYGLFAALCFILLLVLLRLVLRERIMLQGSLSYVLGLMALFPGTANRVAHALGFTLLSNFFFAVAIALLSLLHLRALVTLSKVHVRTLTLTQDLAILQERVEREEKKTSS